MTDSGARDVPATSPEFEERLGLDWLEPPSLLVLRHPVQLHLRLRNISHETLDVVRARDAAVALLSVGGDSVVAGAGGFFALGEETTMRPGDAADVPARGHFGHDRA